MRRLVFESLEDRQLLASVPCISLNSADFGPNLQSATNPCSGHLSDVATDERFDGLPFGVQTIDWQGKPTTVVAGQWIVKLTRPIEENNFTSAPTGISLDESMTVTYRQNLGSADTWVVETEPATEPWQIIAAIGTDIVDYVEPNFLLYAADNVPNDPDFDQLWGLRNSGQTDGTVGADVSATSAWEENIGSREVVVALFDSGIDYNHVDLAANVWQNPHEVPGNGIDDDRNGFVDDVHGIDTFYGDSDPFDGDGHGTHTSGTLGAVGNNGVGISGVAWDVQIMPLKFLADNGIGRTDAAVAALNYMTMMKRDHGINIVASNNSWYGGDRSQALEDAIADSIDAGIVFVAAAGNDRLNNDINPTWPATYPLDGIIAVASTDHEDRLAKSSHFGRTTVDLAAPGVRIYSTLPGNQYGFMSGTSMATPHVTGAVALLKSVYPGASPAQVKSAILAGTQVELLAENGEVISVDQAPGSGHSAVITPFTVLSDGEYRVRILGANETTGSYHLSVLLNASFESESVMGLTNNSLLTAEDLSSRFVAREYDVWQAVVLGRSGDSDNYLVQVNAGDSLSVALATELPVDTRLELLDTEGRLQAVGVSSGRFSQVVDEFLGPDGVYNLHVAGPASDYTLVVTRNGSFDNGGNDVTSLAQSIDADLLVSGFISAPPLKSAGPVSEPDNAPPSLVLSYPELAAADLFTMQAGEWLIAFDTRVSLADANARLQARGITVLHELPCFTQHSSKSVRLMNTHQREGSTPSLGCGTLNRIM